MSLAPDRIMELGWAFVPHRALLAAVNLGLFSALDQGPATVDELAAACAASPRGIRALANALTALGLLQKTAETYQNTPETALFLVRDRPAYLGGMLEHTAALADRFRDLAAIVRSGEAPEAVDQPEHGEAFFQELVPAIFGMSYPQGTAAAVALGAGDSLRGARVLDVAAGSGAFSLPFLQRDPTATAVAVDLPHVLEVTREFATRFGCADRYQYLAGSIRELDFGVAEFDVAVLGHICHSEGALWTQRLLAKVVRALKPGGTLVIGEMVPDDQRREAVFPLLFALNMLVHTSDGDCFTLREYQEWLTAAGCSAIRTVANPGPSPLILATR
ncbi:MAG: methyltransferase domain-containing protein [Fimbriimonadaceae bacterium]|nr:methyltransferase domain-containing protein [Fimbriimonadaceae bacterium]